MKESPIPFNAPMVRATLDGTKKQTRRIAKVRGELPPDWATFASEGHSLSQSGPPRPVGSFFWSEDQQPGQPLKPLRRWPVLPKTHPMAGDWYWTPSPYGKIGDRLWVRETWLPKVSHSCGLNSCDCDDIWVDYVAGGEGKFFSGHDIPAHWYLPQSAIKGNNVPSIHMPRWASRLTLEITGVRVERLQNISDADAEAEGIDFLRHIPDVDETLTPRDLFMCLWDSVATVGADWKSNPWVWVIDFERVAEV